METDFIYWRHSTPLGVTVEEVCGADHRCAAVWKAMAYQVYAENGPDGEYRVIEHTASGAPVLASGKETISITHTPHFLAVASLPASEGKAVGIDAESSARKQVLKVAPRVLSDKELEFTGDDVERNVLAWTIKEAAYKAALHEGVDFRRDISIEVWPEIAQGPMPDNPVFGEAKVKINVPEGSAIVSKDSGELLLKLFAYKSEGHIVTVAVGAEGH